MAKLRAELLCETCGKPFHAGPYRMKNGTARFCSLSCHNTSMQKPLSCHPGRQGRGLGLCATCRSKVDPEYRAKQQAYGRAYYARNKEKISIKNRRQWLANPDRKSKIKADRVKRRYGLTLEEYEDMSRAQGGVCAICGKPDEIQSLSVDHDHKSGFNRGLLCNSCNRGIGMLRDDETVLENALQYLRAHKDARAAVMFYTMLQMAVRQ